MGLETREGWQPSTRGLLSHVLQNVGCDFEIDSGAVEDRCGVCHGNGSTCHTVSGTFAEPEGLGMGWDCCWGRGFAVNLAASSSSSGLPWSPLRLETATCLKQDPCRSQGPVAQVSISVLMGKCPDPGVSGRASQAYM